MKMKAITKRIIAVIIAVLMLASLIPATSVFAAKDQFKDTLLSSAEVTGLTAPKIGADVDTTGTVPSGSNYSIVKVNWFDASGVLTKVTSFEAGKPYRVSVLVKANDGCKFQSGASFKINGSTATETNANTDRTEITFIFQYPALGDGLIKSVKITDITTPKIGADVDTKGSVPSGSNYSIRVKWFDSTIAPFSEVSSFSEGKPYRVAVYATANKGYSFDKKATYTINGKSATETSANSDRTEITFILDYAALEKTETATSSKKPAATSSKVTEESSEVAEETSSEEEIVSETESTTPSSTVSVDEKDDGSLDMTLVILIIAVVALLCITAVVIVIIIKKKK